MNSFPPKLPVIKSIIRSVRVLVPVHKKNYNTMQKQVMQFLQEY
jgi:hypothetical protein